MPSRHVTALCAWRYGVPVDAPGNALLEYAPNVAVPLRPVVTPYA